MQKSKVAFICVHNSCRSQIAEALGQHFAAMCSKAILQVPSLRTGLILMLSA